jgi:PKD repeat protein
VSGLTYAKRKQLYGQSKFPSGFEYYSGGVISVGNSDLLKSATASMYVDNWDWRNRHGKNWITSVTNQGSCGSCWAFAATGATEAMVNVFFNQQLNLNLSEQEVLSCTGYGDCGGGYPHRALDYIKNNGIVDENTFPYNGIYQSCLNKGNNPSEQIKITGRIDFGSSAYPISEDVLKRMLIELGPLSSGLYDWSHAIVLVGYKVVKEGDIFFYRDLSLKRYWKTIAAGDPLIGKTVWIFKNSWGASFGDEGYVYVETPINNIEWTHAIKTPVISVVKNYQVICEDRDGDGYYWWGLGPKPATCNGPDTPDGNDADPTLGPLDQYGYCTVIGASPVVNFTSSKTIITKGETVNFTDFSTNNPISWAWTFTGGTPATSTAKNPAVTYCSAGTYNVTLTVTNASGSSTNTEVNFIQVNEPVTPPVADFAAAKTSLKVGESVQFNDLSSNSPTKWQWSFPGGTPETSTEQKPVVTYKVAGQYDVTLSVSKDGFSPSEMIKLKYIATVDNTPLNYCVPVGIISLPDYIQNVTIGNTLNNSTAGAGYSLSENTVQMVPGQSYSVSLTPKVATNRNYWKLWIDFNGDGDFIDSGETLVTVGNKKGALKTTILIPQNATGIKRMRIAMRTGVTPAPCDGNYKGEVEDYSVTFGVTAQLTKSASIGMQPGVLTDFHVYPNPVNHLLNVQLDSAQPGDFYTIYNINGEKINSKIILSSLSTVDFGNYSPGIYLLRVINGNRVFNERIIKK